jgi:hypothetical protein
MKSGSLRGVPSTGLQGGSPTREAKLTPPRPAIIDAEQPAATVGPSPTGLGHDLLLDVAQAVLAEVDLVADEERGDAEGAAFERAACSR